MRLRTVLLCGLAAAWLVYGADPAYFGKWKMNAAKSDFGDLTFTFTQLSGGEMEFSEDGQSYKFKVDGKEYPAIFGSVATWKSSDASTWECAMKTNGVNSGTSTYKLAADGKSLTVHFTGPKPGGGTSDDTSVFTRVTGTAGLAGKWKTKNVKSSSPDTVELSANGADGMMFTIPDQKAMCALKFDGKDYAVSGPTMPPNFTLAVKKNGSGFDMTVKMGGKALYQSAFTVSPDGKTLTEMGTVLATGEKYKAVSDKQ